MPLTAPRTIVVLAGPTAVGKTELAIQLAGQLGAVIVSADSRQLYRELTIGTAKPSATELGTVPHYFINSHSITAPISAGQYEREALALFETLFQTHQTILLTGGTGLYINAVLRGLDEMPQSNAVLRQQLQQEFNQTGIAPLQARLLTLDPAYAVLADMHNTQRVMRALEVCITTGKPYSWFRRQRPIDRPFNTILLSLDRPRLDLYARIDQRVDQMLANGLVDEARGLLPYRHTTPLQTVGYKEVFPYLDGTCTHADMIELLKQNTRRYAKRQLTWFRHQNQFTWFTPDQEAEMLTLIRQQL